jgi:hypothetical protein
MSLVHNLLITQIGAHMTIQSILDSLKTAEKQLKKELAGIRQAIASLSFGSAASPGILGQRGRPRKTVGAIVEQATRRRRKLSAAGRKAISDAQKARWAKAKAAKAKPKK